MFSFSEIIFITLIISPNIMDIHSERLSNHEVILHPTDILSISFIIHLLTPFLSILNAPMNKNQINNI